MKRIRAKGRILSCRLHHIFTYTDRLCFRLGYSRVKECPSVLELSVGTRNARKVIVKIRRNLQLRILPRILNKNISLLSWNAAEKFIFSKICFIESDGHFKLLYRYFWSSRINSGVSSFFHNKNCLLILALRSALTNQAS